MKRQFLLQLVFGSAHLSWAAMLSSCIPVCVERGLHGGVCGGLGSLTLVFPLALEPYIRNTDAVDFSAPTLPQTSQDDDSDMGKYDPVVINSIAVCTIAVTLKCWLRELASVHQGSFQPVESPQW